MSRCPTSFVYATRIALRAIVRAGPPATGTMRMRAAKSSASSILSKLTTIASTLPEAEYVSDRFITVSKSSLTDQLHLHNALACLVDVHPASLAHTGATRRPLIPAIDLPKNSRRFISMANHSSNNSCHSATLQSNSAAVFRCRQNISGRPIMQENFHPFFPYIAHSAQKFCRGENPPACAMVAQMAQSES